MQVNYTGEDKISTGQFMLYTTVVPYYIYIASLFCGLIDKTIFFGFIKITTPINLHL